YILKPIKIPELQETVSKVVASIAAERSREELAIRLKRQLQENMPALREKFFANLMLGMYKSEQEVLDKLNFFELPLDLSSMRCVAAFQIDEYEKAIERYNEENRQLLSFSINNIMEEIVNRHDAGIAFCMNENEFVVLFDPVASGTSRHLDICQEMIGSINEYLKIPISAGIGEPVHSMLQLHYSYREARSAIEYKFFTGKNSILQISDFKSNRFVVEYPKLYDDQNKLINAMKLGNREEATLKVNDIFDSVCADRNCPVGYVQSVCIELINMASKSFYEMGESIEQAGADFSARFGEVYAKRDVSELRAMLLSLFGELTGYFAAKHNQKNSHMINKIKAIISQNYMENITIARLSEEVFLSPNYISLIFKQETGENITEYVMKVRMEAAKELMKSPDLKILEIAEMVGYENATYFSTVFKKYTGMHPQKYRTLIQSP
ncbi:helix-turn-helix domain-containing protein, partial [Paenibacillus sepulcri]|nr:helix-turn-helix domain-containing protein [Paenibacillus sepulcri]